MTTFLNVMGFLMCLVGGGGIAFVLPKINVYVRIFLGFLLGCVFFFISYNLISEPLRKIECGDHSRGSIQYNMSDCRDFEK